jgi:hypothetical protein
MKESAMMMELLAKIVGTGRTPLFGSKIQRRHHGIAMRIGHFISIQLTGCLIQKVHTQAKLNRKRGLIRCLR